MNKTLLFIFVFAFYILSFSQSQHPKFQELLAKSPNEISAFCLRDDECVTEFLLKENIVIKYRTKEWLFVSTTPHWLDLNQKNGIIKKFYFESAPASILNDTTRLTRFVDPVHNGTGGLAQPYTGANVVVGVIDDGFELNHPDFKDALGKTRVMRLWDQAVTPAAGLTYSKYGYGRLWDSTAINAGLCTQLVKGHGTSVAGIACGNGLANGKNKGMAPDSKMVLVKSNLASKSWALTVADACDFIFKYADSLGLPAVINISAGTYWGSHDGNDPGSKAMEQLLDEKPGRIIVSAAGNSGAWLRYHVNGNVTTDTSFVWFNNDATGASANKVHFDLWSDISQSHFDFAFGADKPAPGYGFRGKSSFHTSHDNLDVVITDTILNGTNRIATIMYIEELKDSAYHLEVFFDKIDSTAYKYRFMTKGSGKYDLWSGVGLGANSIVTTLPSSLLVPEIINYQKADSLQTLVSGFQCSEKVITVGNVRNRFQFMTKNNVMSTITPNSPGNISPSSSSGPSRLGVQKPDISMNGDGSLSVSTNAFLNNPANNGMIAQEGWHSSAGGTSSASPGVAGIAALYLQKFPMATYSDFKRDLIATASQTSFTGTVPNYFYGYGQPHALNLLLTAPTTIPVITVGSVVCGSTSINGTSSEANGTIIEVFKGDVSQGTTTVTANTWSKLVTSLVIGDVITSKATATNKFVSDVGAPLTVTLTSTPIVTVGSVVCGSTSISGTSTEADGTIIEVFKGGISQGTTTVTANTWSKNSLTALIGGDVITISSKATDKCLSALTSSVSINETAVPILTSTCSQTTVIGTSTEVDGTIIEVFKGGVSVGSTIVTANNWTKVSLTPFVNGDIITATALASNKCISPLSTSSLVGLPIPPFITDNIGVITSDSQVNYQWSLNGVVLPGEVSQLIFITPPYGVYTVSTSIGGCVAVSNSITINAGLDDKVMSKYLKISPNPTTGDFRILSDVKMISVSAADMNGKEVELIEKSESFYSIVTLKQGTYFIKIVTEKGLFRSKIVKL